MLTSILIGVLGGLFLGHLLAPKSGAELKPRAKRDESLLSQFKLHYERSEK